MSNRKTQPFLTINDNSSDSSSSFDQLWKLRLYVDLPQCSIFINSQCFDFAKTSYFPLCELIEDRLSNLILNEWVCGTVEFILRSCFIISLNDIECFSFVYSIEFQVLLPASQFNLVLEKRMNFSYVNLFKISSAWSEDGFDKSNNVM